MSSMIRAWYVFVLLGLVTFLLTAFVGRVPADLTAAVALPHDLLHQAGVNLQLTMQSAVDRRDLRAEVARLEEQLFLTEQARRNLEMQLERLAQAQSVRTSQSPAVVAVAPVVGGDSGPEIARLRLGLGSSSGLQRNMPVTVPSGLVGIITEVAGSSAVVTSVLDPQSRVGVSVRGKGGQGIAVGEVGGLIRVTRFIVDGQVEVGDVVETSSFGGLFPAGILVGVVQEVLPPDPNDLRRSFLIRPGVEMATLREVVVLAPQ